MWFRRDLRLTDLPALAAAMEAGTVAPLFVFDDRLVAGRWRSPNRNAFLLECVRALDTALHARGSRLHLRHGDPRVVVPAFAAECGAEAVCASRDYTPVRTPAGRGSFRGPFCAGYGTSPVPRDTGTRTRKCPDRGRSTVFGLRTILPKLVDLASANATSGTDWDRHRRRSRSRDLSSISHEFER